MDILFYFFKFYFIFKLYIIVFGQELAPPLRTTEAPPLPPRQALDLPERADEPQAGTQTDTQTLARTHAKGDSWPAQAPQPEPERLGEAGARRTGRRLAVRRYRGRNT